MDKVKAELMVYDKDHIWWERMQYISITRVAQMMEKSKNHAHWEGDSWWFVRDAQETPFLVQEHQCSVCHRWVKNMAILSPEDYLYCPHCGCRMDEGKE